MTWKKIQEKTIRMEAKMPEIMKYVARPCLVVWFEFQGFTDPYYYRHLLSKKLPMRHKQAMHL